MVVLPEMRRNFQHAPELMLADCTYKSNRYDRPLMVISGVDEENITYLIAVGLLLDETKESYEWIFESLRAILGDDSCDRVSVFRTDGEASFAHIARKYLPKAVHHRFAILRLVWF
jgi:hypothetical protein